jgi:hypothetical protein
MVKREAQTMWLLNGHPYTVQSYGAVMEKKVGLVFACCNAGTLQSHLYAISLDCDFIPLPRDHPAALSPAHQQACLTHILNAAALAHGKAVVHSRPQVAQRAGARLRAGGV